MIVSDKDKIETYTGLGVWGELTLDGLLAQTARETPEHTALIDPPNKEEICAAPPLRFTYAEADAVVDRLADTFLTLGLKPDDIVALQLPNSAEAVLTILACSRAGLIVCPLPVIWREHELREALPNIAPSALITANRICGVAHAEMMRQVAVDLMTVRFVLGFGNELPDGVMSLQEALIGAGEGGSSPRRSAFDPNSILTLTWQSELMRRGLTIPRSHNQWVSAGLMLLLEAGLDADSVILNPYPPSSLAPLAMISAWLLSGGTLVQHHPFSHAVFLDQIDAEEISFTMLPPGADTLFSDQDRDMMKARLNAMGCVLIGGLPAGEDAAPLNGMARNTIDIEVLDEYALLATRRREGRLQRAFAMGAVERPTHSMDRIALAELNISGPGRQTGGATLMLQSPMAFDSFFPPAIGENGNHPIVDASGFLDTGLPCALTDDDPPRLEISRQRGDVFIHGGVPVSAHELDSLYASHEALSDAAALSVDDPVMGQRILAAIVPNPGLEVSFEEFRDFLVARKVAPYKIPERMVTVKSIPRGEHGEVLRDDVIDQV
ncbi:MAG: hypothetical protein C0605_10005 [Hyphomicrobiales bacterium]|nr:MAG: hypothetical protein C0605_10005 [Hyphomicrobiales bacterium]